MGRASFVESVGRRGKGTPITRALSKTDVSGKVTQVIVDPTLQDLIRVHNPLWANTPRKPGAGPQAQISQRTARGAAGFVADTDTPAAVKSTYGTPPTFPYKTILYPGAVTRFAGRITANYINLYAEEIESGVQEVRDVWEDTWLNGDVSGDAKSFSGFTVLLGSGQKLDIDTDGAPLSLAKIDESLDLMYGKPSYGILSQRTQRQLNALLQVQQRFANTTVVNGGFTVPTYNEIPLYWSQFQADDETCGASDDCSSLNWFNTKYFYAEDLTPLFRMPLARTTSQYEAFDIGMDTVAVLSNEKYLGRLQGIRPTG